MIDQDARALWERFDAFIPGMGYNPDPMSSLNHMGFCSVGEWIFQTVSGIYPDPGNPAYSRIIIEPRMEGPLGEASAVYHSVRGEISSRWTVIDNKVSLELVIPPNTSALVRLPATDPEKVTESRNPITKSEGIVFKKMRGNFAEYEVLSGNYLFAYIN
jgi:alpha-L-rhamnosidase